MLICFGVIAENTFFISHIVHILLRKFISIYAEFYLANVNSLVASVNQ